MQESFFQKLERKGILLLDSAMGTMLQQAGLKSGEECGELWNVGQNREKVLKVHKANIDSGSDIIITNTFGANPLKLAHYGASGQTRELNRAGALLAREAAGEQVFVAGDLGPTGEILEQWGGTRSAGEIRAAYEDQVAGLLEGGVDLFILETFMDLEELKLALEAIKTASSLPVVASMTFQANPRGVRTMWGLTPAEAARELQKAGAGIIGSNCGMGTRQMLQVVAEMARVTELPLAVQPNAGMPEVRNGKTYFPETAEQMAAVAPEFKAEGVRLLGGCCGSTPEYIGAIKNKLGL
ncbi:MAG TPA: homocysteine S-methyltransferase family protein [archaeon]|nr:homocysteine S-methyltransferase family protein [archaeon]